MYYRNAERLADIDEGSLWSLIDNKFILVNEDDARELGKDWSHIMVPVPDPNNQKEETA